MIYRILGVTGSSQYQGVVDDLEDLGLTNDLTTRNRAANGYDAIYGQASS